MSYARSTPTAGSSLRWWVVLGAAALISACAADAGPSTDGPTAPTPTGAVGTSDPTPDAGTTASVTDTVTTGLQAPWSLVWLPDGSALITERDTAVIKRLAQSDGRWITQDLRTVDGVDANGEGGLLGLAVIPDDSGASSASVYAYWSTDADNRIGVMQWDGENLSEPQVVFDGIPHATFHNGGRLIVGPDGKLYVATGDAGEPEAAQDPASLAGKVLRLNPDGSPAEGNPAAGSPVFSLGHRNIQGLAFDDEGRLWASEFGSKDVDELNLITAGGNYGWPLYEGPGNDPAYIDPVAQWEPTSVASPSGLAIAAGSAWVAGLRGQTLWQVPLDGARAAGPPVPWFEEQFGRLRDVVVAPDGSLWLITSNTDGRGDPDASDDRVVRIVLQP